MTKVPVSVVVEEKGPYPSGDIRRLVVTSPGQSERTNADWGDHVEWTFDNKSTFELELGVGNFRAAERYKTIDEKRNVPVEPLNNGPTKIQLASNKAGALTYEVKSQPNQPQGHGDGAGRTFKYDIVDYSRLLVLLDPEIEIYKP